MTSIDSAVSGENAYFLLDLKLPDLLKDVSSDQPGNQSSSSGTLVKFGFLALLEQIHERDLCSKNPWFNPAAFATMRHRWKAVRFCTTEISSAVLPHCRRKCKLGRTMVGPGQHVLTRSRRQWRCWGNTPGRTECSYWIHARIDPCHQLLSITFTPHRTVWRKSKATTKL